MLALVGLGVWTLILDWRVSQQERLERCTEIAETVHKSVVSGYSNDSALARSLEQVLSMGLASLVSVNQPLVSDGVPPIQATQRRLSAYDRTEIERWLQNAPLSSALLQSRFATVGFVRPLSEPPLEDPETFPAPLGTMSDTPDVLGGVSRFLGIPPDHPDSGNLNALGSQFAAMVADQEPTAESARLAYAQATEAPTEPATWRLDALRHAAQPHRFLTTSGLPISQLAGVALVEQLAQSRPNEEIFPALDAAYASLAQPASFLSEPLIQRLKKHETRYADRDSSQADRALRALRAERVSREFHNAAKAAFVDHPNVPFWFHWDDRQWLCFRDGPLTFPAAVPDFVVRQTVVDRFGSAPRIRLPQGTAIEIRYGERRVLAFDDEAALLAFAGGMETINAFAMTPYATAADLVADPPEPLARVLELSDPANRTLDQALATYPLPDSNEPSPLEVRVALLDPIAFNAARNARLARFGTLIAGAFGLAATGLVFAHRAYRRQVEYGRLQSDFVSSVSHELRTPIASIRLMAENLDSDRVSNGDRVKEYYRFIRAEAARLGALVDNTLDLSRIERGRDAYDFQPVALRRLVDSAVQSVAPLAQSRGAPIRVQWPESEELLGAIWDGSAIQRALINLLDNAIKHAPDGTETLLKVHYASPDESFTFAVIDRGPGVPEGLRERVFERFFRIESGPIRETPGAGIGLSLVRHIAQAHGGTVVVEETSGGGGTFKLILPILPPGIAPE